MRKRKTEWSQEDQDIFEERISKKSYYQRRDYEFVMEKHLYSSLFSLIFHGTPIAMHKRPLSLFQTRFITNKGEEYHTPLYWINVVYNSPDVHPLYMKEDEFTHTIEICDELSKILPQLKNEVYKEYKIEKWRDEWRFTYLVERRFRRDKYGVQDVLVFKEFEVMKSPIQAIPTAFTDILIQ